MKLKHLLILLLPIIALFNCIYVTNTYSVGLHIEDNKIEIGKEVSLECYIIDGKYDHHYYAKSIIPDSIYGLNSRQQYEYFKKNNILDLHGEHDCGYNAISSFELLDTSKACIRKIDFNNKGYRRYINLIIKDTGSFSIQVIASDTFKTQMVVDKDSIKTKLVGKMFLKRKRSISIINLPLSALFKKWGF
jgi:hypothetical protein